MTALMNAAERTEKHMSHATEHGHAVADAACNTECPLAEAAERTNAAQFEGERLRLDRRGFLTTSMMMAAAAALAACGIGSGFDAITAPANVNATVNVADYPALATVGGIALASVNGAPLALVRTGASSFIALSRACPHQGTIVNTDSSGGFTCPRHRARFDAHGSWLGGQPTSNMRSYAVTYDATAGTLTIS